MPESMGTFGTSIRHRVYRDEEMSRVNRCHRHAQNVLDEMIDAGVPVVVPSKWSGAEHSRPWKG